MRGIENGGNMASEWITIAEATKLSGYHKDTLRELAREGRIKGRKFVTVWQINRASLQAYLKRAEMMGEKRGRKPLDVKTE
jgi:excisionase family DNA binding protein